MNYIIKTTDAAQLKDTILSCVEKKKDPDKRDIFTWNVANTDKKEKVLVHETDQWEEKGLLKLLVSEDNKEIEFVFSYWSSFKKEDRSGDEKKYLFGRFTELFLVHFWKSGLKVEIS